MAADVTENATDSGQLVPLEAQVEANTGVRTATLVADSGYKAEANFAALER